MKIIDAKPGQPKAADQVQVMLYMLLLPMAKPDLTEKKVKGQVAYGGHTIDIEPEELTPAFINSLQDTVGKLAAKDPAVKVPSWGDCQFCDISNVNCPRCRPSTPSAKQRTGARRPGNTREKRINVAPMHYYG